MSLKCSFTGIIIISTSLLGSPALFLVINYRLIICFVHGISLSLRQLKRILQGMNLRRRMYIPYTSHSTIMIVCAERMLSRLDPLGTLQRKRLLFTLLLCLQTCYSDVLFKLMNVHKLSYSIAVNTISCKYK